MSTKRLQRTVIEGGRYGYNKYKRRHSSKELRAKIREYMDNVENDWEYADDESEPDRKKVHKGFSDKLSPMYRWLRSQTGRPWDEVRSEVFQKFDTRTTAGRHITFDHLLSSVEEVPDLDYHSINEPYDPITFTTSYREYNFYVDEAGILREKAVTRRHEKIPFFDTKAIANWLNGRVVGKVGKKFFWFEPCDTFRGYSYQWITKWYERYNHLLYYLLHYEVIHERDAMGHLVMDENGKYKVKEYKPVWKLGRPNFRQYRKLNDKEMQFWNSMPEFYQNKVLEYSPTSPKKPKYDYYNYYRYSEYHE